MCDVDIGGYSKASFDHIPESTIGSEVIPAHARFYGNISTALPPHRPDIQRSGFAAWRTKDMPATLFGRTVWDIDMYRYIALRVRSDGRSYFVNLHTESVVPEDLHQHRLFAKRPGEWETILIKWNDFVRTNHGFVVEPQTEMLRQRVKSVGIGLTDRVPGPYDLSIERIWATNDASEFGGDHAVVSLSPEEALSTAAEPETGAEESSEMGGQLRNKKGRNIRWSD
jgi:NADH dehydrogenase [ubiquinone] 1 alpha subcomplex assembly factor 1